MVTSLTYASMAVPKLTMQDVKSIVDVSQQHNASAPITGVLCYGNQRFMQCIEGSRAVINALYNKLVRDSRHGELILLDYKTMDTRMFSDWSMGFIHAEDMELRQLIRQTTFMDQFQPELLEASQANRLLANFKSFLSPQIFVNIEYKTRMSG